MFRKSEDTILQCVEKFRRGKFTEALHDLARFADRGINNYHTENIYHEAIDDEFSEFDGGVVISAEAAEVAQRELEILIQETGGDAGFVFGKGPSMSERAMSPVGLARLLISQRTIDMEGDRMVWFKDVEEAFKEVAERSGADISQNDPLQSDIFEALHEIDDALEARFEEAE